MIINKCLPLTPGIVHCLQSALSKVSSTNILQCNRTIERLEPGNEPYPKPLATSKKTKTPLIQLC